jgi:hypothetical protein
VICLIIESIKRSCAFVIRIDMPLRTSVAILELLTDRKTLVDSMQMQVIGGGEAILILHARIEKDRVRHVRHRLEKINGVLSVELLEGRGGYVG